MLGCIHLNITKSDIMKCKSMDAVKTMLAKEFYDIDRTSEGMRVAVDAHQFLDVAEIPASDKFNKHFGKMLYNTTCLLLCKDDYSKMAFVRKVMGMTGNNVYQRYVVDIRQPRTSDVARLKNIQYGNTATFTELFNTKDVVKGFYRQYKSILDKLQKSITKIIPAKDKQRYSQILLSRIMFLYFIQARGLLECDTNYLRTKFVETKRNNGNYYRDFLCVLFFDVLNTEKSDRRHDLGTPHHDFGTIPFLNGGLFKEHAIEIKNKHIGVENHISADILMFLGRWLWYVDDTADEANTTASVNPEILGHIFETLIEDQHGKGAYYTPPDVTQYICEQTILQYCVERANDTFGTKYKTIQDIICDREHAEYLYFDVVKPIRVLDPACGSGEFVLTAYKMLYELYRELWSVISKYDSERVKAEYELFGDNPNYYFKRRIITENVYGVDIESGALEVCKLRLWLSLVADMDVDNVEPLPNIDYNIMQGNSLVGYTEIPKKQQFSLDSPYRMEDTLKKITQLKDTYNAETDPKMAAAIKDSIEREVAPCNDLLSKLLASHIAPSGHRLTAGQMKKIKPFHWRLHFHDIMQTGGFNVIVGNPPYGANVDYPTSFLKTGKTGNTYAFFIEVSMSLLRPDGRFGYIIPVSGVSTEYMIPLQRILLRGCSKLGVSSYDFRPGKIFEGKNNNRLAIILGAKKASVETACAVSTTRYHRWYAADRKILFENIKYVPLNFESKSVNFNEIFANIGTIPKIGEAIEKQIFQKIFQKPMLKHEIIPKSNFVVWYHNTPLYWIRAMNVPKFTPDVSLSSHVKRINLKNQNAATIVLALLNSSLFYWFFIKVSGCRDLTNGIINNMPVGINDFTAAELTKLNSILENLMYSYKQNCQIDIRKNKKNEKITVKHSKPIIDMIDDVLAEHYRFTQDEAMYIKQFDEKFRMSDG